MKSRAVQLALFCIGFTVLFGSSVPVHAQSAAHWYKQGQNAEAKDDVEAAYEAYYKAYQKKPSDLRYKTVYERTRFEAATLHIKRGQKLRDQGDNTGALTEFLRALEIDPSNELASQEIQATREKMNAPPNQETSLSPNDNPAFKDIGGPPQLKPISNEPITIHSVEDSKIVYQTVGKLAGINVLFDPDYTSKRIQVDLTNVDLYDALRIIGTVSGTFWRPITNNTIFVAVNNRGKRAELEEEAVQTFYLTNVSQQQDLNDVQTALRNVFTTAKLYAVPSQDAIIMRGTPDELLLAQKLINDLDKARPEVVVDVAIMEVNRDKTRTIGIQLPNSATINFQQSNANTTNSSSSSSSSSSDTGTSGSSTGSLTLNNLAHLNSTNFAIGISQATANLILSDSNTKVLQNPRVRASDGQQAVLKIGEKLPVATGSYQTGAATAIVSSLVNTQFQYLDVGVNVDMKPTIHYNRDVTLKVKIEVSSSTTSVNLGGVNEPVIQQQSIEQTIRLKEGEASILGGILTRSDSHTIGGIPGLGEVPILKYLFSSDQHEQQDEEIVFMLIPHVVRAEEISPLNTREIDTGTTNSIELRRIHTDAAPPQATPAVETQPSSVPGQTVERAATNAIQQMRQEAGAGAPVSLQLAAPPVQRVGSSFQVAVNLAGGEDVFSVPLQLQYDSARLNLVNVDLGNFLNKDGQPVALVHRDDGSGGVAISASRPPGVKGVSGGGSVVMLTFQAKSAGDASIAITRPVVRNSSQQSLPATGSQAVVHVQ